MKIDHYYEKLNFRAYLRESIVLFDKSYHIVDDFINSLGAFLPPINKLSKSKCESKIILEKFNIDMKNIIKKSKLIGAWFNYENMQNLKSSAAFGNNVDQSMLYTTLEKNGGKLSSVVISLEFSAITHTVIISRNGSIAIMNNIDKLTAIALADYIIKEIIL